MSCLAARQGVFGGARQAQESYLGVGDINAKLGVDLAAAISIERMVFYLGIDLGWLQENKSLEVALTKQLFGQGQHLFPASAEADRCQDFHFYQENAKKMIAEYCVPKDMARS